MIKLVPYIALAAAVAIVVSYLVEVGYSRSQKEVITIQQDSYIKTRKRIDEATKPSSSVDAARERMQQRLEERNKNK